jgi:hypothetical protein
VLIAAANNPAAISIFVVFDMVNLLSFTVVVMFSCERSASLSGSNETSDHLFGTLAWLFDFAQTVGTSIRPRTEHRDIGFVGVDRRIDVSVGEPQCQQFLGAVTRQPTRAEVAIALMAQEQFW